MINQESIRYSLRNLKHRKARSFLTIFSILVGITTIFIFISFGLGLYNYVNSFTTGSPADKLMIMAKGVGVPGIDDSIPLNDTDIKSIKRVAGVYSATGVYYNVAQLEKFSQTKYAFLVSYNPSNPLILDISQIGIEKGRSLQTGDGAVAILGYNYLIPDKIFKKPLEINDKINMNGESFRVIGFFEPVGNPQDDSNVYITNKEFEKLYPSRNYAEIIAKVDISSMKKVIQGIGKSLRKERGLEKGKEDFFVQSFEDMIQSYSRVLNIIVGFIILIALISVIVSAINTANTMITSVLERYKEIGVLKAIGARNSEIFMIFLFESSFLGLIAGLLGVGIGYLITSAVGKILSSVGWGFLQPLYSWQLFIGCILFALITGAISGALPALKASKINPVDSLRYE